MKKHRAVTYALLLLLVVTSCQKPANSSSSADSSTESPTTDSSGTISTNTTSSATSESITEVPSITSLSSESGSENTSETSEPPAINTAIKSFHSNSVSYATTNGNANNKGLAVYDHTRHLHYFSLGKNVYSYNPTTAETKVLFSEIGAGTVQNLALLTDDLYFVSTVSNYLYRFNLVNETISLVYEDETSVVYGYFNTIFATLKRVDSWGQVAEGLATYNHSKKEATTKFRIGTTTVNINGNRLYYTNNYVADLQLMADGFNGQTGVYNFTKLGFEEIISAQLVSASYTSPEVLVFALILKDSARHGLYLYNNSDDSLLEIKAGANIHSVNSDGEYIYFIENSSLYKYHVATKVLSNGITLFNGAKYIQVLNHWLYISNATHTTLHRYNPNSQEFETDFW